MTREPDTSTLEDDGEIRIERILPARVPPPEDPKWIRNAKGEIVGYENTRIMTREEIERMYGQ